MEEQIAKAPTTVPWGLIGIGLAAVVVGAVVAPTVVHALHDKKKADRLEQAHRSYENR